MLSAAHTHILDYCLDELAFNAPERWNEKLNSLAPSVRGLNKNKAPASSSSRPESDFAQRSADVEHSSQLQLSREAQNILANPADAAGIPPNANYVHLLEQCLTIFYIGQAYDYRLNDQLKQAMRCLDTCLSQTKLLLKTLICLQSMMDYCVRRSVHMRVVAVAQEGRASNLAETVIWEGNKPKGGKKDSEENSGGGWFGGPTEEEQKEKQERKRHAIDPKAPVVLPQNLVGLLLTVLDVYPNWRKVQGAAMFALHKTLETTEVFQQAVAVHCLPTILMAHVTHIQSYAVQYHFLCILETIGRNFKLSE